MHIKRKWGISKMFLSEWGGLEYSFVWKFQEGQGVGHIIIGISYGRSEIFWNRL